MISSTPEYARKIVSRLAPDAVLVGLGATVLVGVGTSPSAVAAPPRRMLESEQTFRMPCSTDGTSSCETFRNWVCPVLVKLHRRRKSADKNGS